MLYVRRIHIYRRERRKCRVIYIVGVYIGGRKEKGDRERWMSGTGSWGKDERIHTSVCVYQVKGKGMSCFVSLVLKAGRKV